LVICCHVALGLHLSVTRETNKQTNTVTNTTYYFVTRSIILISFCIKQIFVVTCSNYRSTQHETSLHNNNWLPVLTEIQTVNSSSLSRVAPVCGSFKVPTGGAVSCMSRFCAANIPSPPPPLGHHCYRRHHQTTWQHCSTGKKGKQVTPSTFLRPQLLPL